VIHPLKFAIINQNSFVNTSEEGGAGVVSQDKKKRNQNRPHNQRAAGLVNANHFYETAEELANRHLQQHQQQRQSQQQGQQKRQNRQQQNPENPEQH
jgi:hypothetical protein